MVIILTCACWRSLLYITFSKILEKDVNRDTGLYADISVLFPFLNIGEICENFKCAGKTPEDNILLIIKIKDEINGILSFTIHDGTSSYPNDFFHFKFLLIS